MNPLCRFAGLAALAALSWFALSAEACDFCDGARGLPLVEQFDSAEIVLFGHFENARLAPGGKFDQGLTDFMIERAYKEHDMVKGKKFITFPHHIRDSKNKYVVFCDVSKGKIEGYKATQLVDADAMRNYIDGAIKVKDKSPPERLRFAFDFLTSPETEVSLDAYRQFARADYRDYKDMAKKLDADKIAGWLEDPKTPRDRIGLYASLLGHCGKAKHAKLLMSMIEDPERRRGSGLYGLMAAYTMLEPEKGWKYVKGLVRDKELPFLTRYYGLQSMRFLHDARPDLLNKDEAAARKEIVAGVVGILSVSDMADFAIEDLRKWKRWETSDQVLGLFGQKEFNTSVIKKAILRYALQCPNNAAKTFVEAQRKRDREWVDDTKELLDLETPSPAAK